jgi:opacity protein-like surface antigen
MGKNSTATKRGNSIRTFRYSIISLFLFLTLAHRGEAADQLLYFEAQGIAGYSSLVEKPIYYSMNPDAEMQKPSLGFDYLKRFSGEFGDWATLAVQGRLALIVRPEEEEGEDQTKLEPQIYNAYFKVKTPGPYVWIGHNRPAFGLSSYFDSHALLLRTLAIQGFGYDRDWGAGLYKDFSWGDISASATTGSGMPVYFKGNYMISARVSYGVLSRDNMNLGFSLGYGNTLDTMGYRLRNSDPETMMLAGADLTILRNNLEHRFEVLGGKWLGSDTYALFYRFGINLDSEGRLKVEAQPAYWRTAGEDDYQLALGFSVLATSNLTVRLAYTYDHLSYENMVVLQLYYYRPVTFRSKNQ